MCDYVATSGRCTGNQLMHSECGRICRVAVGEGEGLIRGRLLYLIRCCDVLLLSYSICKYLTNSMFSGRGLQLRMRLIAYIRHGSDDVKYRFTTGEGTIDTLKNLGFTVK